MNTKILYVSSDWQTGCDFQKKFIQKCNGASKDICITANFLGISGLESQKKRGFNVLFVDFSVIESNVERGVQAIKAFFKKDPENPVVIFCDDRNQLVRVLNDKRVEDVTAYVFEKGSLGDFQQVCNIVADFAEV